MKQKILLLALLFGILLAGSVNATLSDTTKNIFDSFEDYLHAYDTEISEGKVSFSDTYSIERKIIDGMLFFILFLSISILGLRKWYGKSTPAVNGIAISLAALMTLALLSYTKATMGLLFPFAKNLLFFIMLFIVYSIVNKNIVKSKGWAFILAIILTLIMFNMEGLIEDTVRGENHSVFSTLRKGVDPAYNYKRNVVRPALRVIEIRPEEPTVPITPRATCNDEIQNQGETGVDCGGPCPACEEPVSEKYCEKKEDCACGKHITRGDCFFGNKRYVRPGTSNECGTFCTGQGSLICSGNRCGFAIVNGCSVSKKERITKKITRNNVEYTLDESCECGGGFCTANSCAAQCGYKSGQWIKETSEKVYHVKSKRELPKVDSSRIKELKKIAGNKYNIGAYNKIWQVFFAGSVNTRQSMGIGKNPGTLPGWERVVNGLSDANYKTFRDDMFKLAIQ